LKYKSELCGYCGACVSVCPVNILELNDWRLEIQPLCENCGRCIIVCPVGALEEADHEI